MQLNKRLVTFSLTAAVLPRPEWVILDGEVCSWQILSARTIFCICDPHGKTGLTNFHHRREKKKKPRSRGAKYRFHDVNLNFYAVFTQVQDHFNEMDLPLHNCLRL